MSQIIPPPVKIEFPEQVVLSNQISGSRTTVAATEKAVGTLNQKVNELKRAVERRPNLFNGNTAPGDDLGRDGDVYFLTE